MITLDKIYHASYVLKDVIRPTDIIKATNIQSDSQLYLKTENLQVTGSFKVRGAYYKISQLTPEERANGVIACSAGNHAQGVALAATKNNIKALICIPDAAPISKIEATKSYGAEVCLVEGTYDDAHEKAVELQAQSGATFIHPFDDDMVIAGQGTIGLEILDQLPDVDAAPSMYKSVKDNEIITLPTAKTIADGIAVKTPGDNTFEICKKYVDEIITVTDDQIATAILTLMEKQKLVSEGAGATTVAAALFGNLPIKGKKVVCLISGGNIDVTILSRVINRGLQTSGRLADLTIELQDRPGQLRGVSKIIANLGGNIIAINHDKAELGKDINLCLLKLSMETRNHEHIEEIKNALIEHGYKIIQ